MRRAGTVLARMTVGTLLPEISHRVYALLQGEYSPTLLWTGSPDAASPPSRRLCANAASPVGCTAGPTRFTLPSLAALSGFLPGAPWP